MLASDIPSAIRDAAIVAAAQRVEHSEISEYGTARTLAEHMGFENAAGLLQETLDEESAADDVLTDIVMRNVYEEEGDEVMTEDTSLPLIEEDIMDVQFQSVRGEGELWRDTVDRILASCLLLPSPEREKAFVRQVLHLERSKTRCTSLGAQHRFDDQDCPEALS